jgi:hypothetical protein
MLQAAVLCNLPEKQKWTKLSESYLIYPIPVFLDRIAVFCFKSKNSASNNSNVSSM